MTASDLELLKQFTRDQSQDAFTALVQRHVNLVYSAALRQVRSPQLAEEVAQSVFIDLACCASRLRHDTVLSAWLYRVTHRAAIDVVRREARRRARESLAAEVTAMNTSPPDWQLVEPLLDDAMGSLDDSDRAAILLRYFENRSLRAVGQALGITDDAAQKRVGRALERLRKFLTKRGVTVGASGLAAAISANAVQAAPLHLAASISAAAGLAATALTAAAATATTTKAIAMTTLQKAFVSVTLLTAVGAGIYQARQASALRTRVAELRQQPVQTGDRTQQLQQERDKIAARLAALQRENEQLRQTVADVPRLRGEVTRLRAIERQLSQLNKNAPRSNDPFTQSVLSFTARAAELNQDLEQMPQLSIPELSLLSEADWIEAGKVARLGSDAEVRQSLMLLRSRAKQNSYSLWQTALKAYLKANNGQLPDDTLQLKPYFETPIDDAILQRYVMLQSGNIAEHQNDRWLIAEKAPVDEQYDTRMRMGIDTLEIAPVAANQ